MTHPLVRPGVRCEGDYARVVETVEVNGLVFHDVDDLFGRHGGRAANRV